MKTLQKLVLISVIWVISGTATVSAHDFEDVVLTTPPSNFRTTENNSSSIIGSTDPYTLPYVIWVVMRNATDTLVSRPQLDSARVWLNRDFANTSGFGPNSGISFAPAQLDPNGNPTTGIKYVDGSILPAYSTYGVNVVTSSTGFSVYEFGNYGMTWDHIRYINIYIVHSIYNGYGGVTSNVPGFYGEGVFIKASEIPRGTHSLAHEMGHYFNLLHTFEGEWSNGTSWQCPSNNQCLIDGDKVCDTPPHTSSDQGSTSICMSGDVSASTRNFMSYGANKNRFTAGQIERMRNYTETTRSGLTTGDAFVQPVPTIEVAVTAIENQNVVYSCGKFDLEFTLKNQGRTTITTCKAKVSIDGGSPVIVVIPVGIATGQSVICSTSVPVTIGSHTVCVQISDFNGSLPDSIVGNNSLCKTIDFQKKMFYVAAQRASTDLTVTGTDNYLCGVQVNFQADYDTSRFEFQYWKDEAGQTRSLSRYWSFNADSNAYFMASVVPKKITAVINHAQDNSVKIYPNPATDQFTVELSSQSLSKSLIEIIDITGRIVIIQDFSTRSSVVDISQLSAGEYIVHITDDQGSLVSKILKN